MRKGLFILTVLAFMMLSGAFGWTLAQDIAPAKIINDEGGPAIITGKGSYTNVLAQDFFQEPAIVLNDVADGYVDRNYEADVEQDSQVLGQITSDVFTSPFSYILRLPAEPTGKYRDVDNNGKQDKGVLTYDVAFMFNMVGNMYIEKRDVYWGYGSSRFDIDYPNYGELKGGKLLVYAPDDQQAFPSGFGDDGKAFTKDDPVVRLPQGWTIVDLDTKPFTFDRSKKATLDIIEPEDAVQDDYSKETYTKAFDDLIAQVRNEYAYTQYRKIDWDAKAKEYRPRIEKAEADKDSQAFAQTLDDLANSIGDVHVYLVGAQLPDPRDAWINGGLGLAIRELDDGKVIASYVSDDGPAGKAGIKLKAEISTLDGKPLQEAIESAHPCNTGYANPIIRHLDQVRCVLRFAVDTEVEVGYKNPGDTEVKTAKVKAVAERASLTFSRLPVYGPREAGSTLPVDFKIRDDGYGYVKIYGFEDNPFLTMQLWERMMKTLKAQQVKGLIIDMRQNGGGWPYLYQAMAAYFFDEKMLVGKTGKYEKKLGDFYFDPLSDDKLYPPAKELRYKGPVAVLIASGCASACEFFSYDLSLSDRIGIVGQYPTVGAGGGTAPVLMPDGLQFWFTQERAVDAKGNIHIEGKGVVPTVKVPVNEETAVTNGDPVLDGGVKYLDEATKIDVKDGGSISIGDTKSGDVAKQTRVKYELSVKKGDKFTITLSSDDKVDTYLRVYDKDGNQVDENDNGSADTTNAMLEEEIPEDMTLTIEAASVDDRMIGKFTLKITGAAEATPEATAEATPEATPGG